jgi:hypothetical protein
MEDEFTQSFSGKAENIFQLKILFSNKKKGFLDFKRVFL